MTAERAEARRARLEALQALFIRLLFCDETLARFRTAPDELAAACGLPVEALRDLPDPDSAQMRAERHGRKMGVLAEIRRNFPNAWPVLERMPEFRIERFLSSEIFFDPRSALPHPYGVGQGYENSSKFFFWARDALGLAAPGAAPELRLALCGDFASYLITQHARDACDYYDRFANGVVWRERPEAELPVIFMTGERHVFRLAERAARDTALRGGAADLDALAPEPVPHRPNIR